ncbi:RecX family transcriptional regulator [Desmospora profundinema]|uniref:Regulatory protein RecX n=1 Tax=Desmospora profundinema TaxID=1571184 RepID=A0ABU1II84_9BACL|nr:RecX family transcriptional regulator [Desmospora profundinema]MDR6224257.1 regulatory protein [Desmospora profundinema]
METGTITRIERQKSGAPRYNIHIDGEYRLAVHEDVLVRFALSKGMKVDPDEWKAILEEEEANKANQAALRFLGIRPRTTAEVERHLTGKGFASRHIASVLSRMKREGYLDDRRFAREWVEERSRRKGYGPLLLRQELEQKGISPEWIEEALLRLEGDEESRIREVAEKRYARLRRYSWPTVERRLGQYLLRRGFPASRVYPVLRELQARHQGEEE